MTDGLRMAVAALMASGGVAVTVGGALLARRLRDREDDAAVASLCRRWPRSSLAQLEVDADLSQRRTSAALVRLIRAGRVLSEGGHAGLEHTVFRVKDLER